MQIIKLKSCILSIHIHIYNFCKSKMRKTKNDYKNWFQFLEKFSERGCNVVLRKIIWANWVMNSWSLVLPHAYFSHFGSNFPCKKNKNKSYTFQVCETAMGCDGMAARRNDIENLPRSWYFHCCCSIFYLSIALDPCCHSKFLSQIECAGWPYSKQGANGKYFS